MSRGRIKLWLPSKSYGFVEPEDGTKDVFFHASVLSTQAINVGDLVTYELAAGTKIPMADRVVKPTS